MVLATNLFNLFDLRPGRAEKAIVLLGLDFASVPGRSLRLVARGLCRTGFGRRLVHLGERSMLGDTGSNLIGAIAGVGC